MIAISIEFWYTLHPSHTSRPPRPHAIVSSPSRLAHPGWPISAGLLWCTGAKKCLMQKRSPRSGLRPLRRILVLLAGIALFIYWLRRQPPGSLQRSPAGSFRMVQFACRLVEAAAPGGPAQLCSACAPSCAGATCTTRRRCPRQTQKSLPDAAARWRRARSPDGTYNDLAVPAMGSARTRFGRNVPLAAVAFDESRLLTPNPRTVSQQLLTRQSFQPATILNLLAAAWLQFQLHDWLSHGPNDGSHFIEVPLADDDPWYQHPMLVPRTSADPTRTAGRRQPPSHLRQHRQPVVGWFAAVRQQPARAGAAARL